MARPVVLLSWGGENYMQATIRHRNCLCGWTYSWNPFNHSFCILGTAGEFVRAFVQEDGTRALNSSRCSTARRAPCRTLSDAASSACCWDLASLVQCQSHVSTRSPGSTAWPRNPERRQDLLQRSSSTRRSQ